VGRNGHILLNKIFDGIYSMNEIENLLNFYDFPKVKLELKEGLLNITTSIGLCFDEYLSNCLGFDCIGDFE